MAQGINFGAYDDIPVSVKCRGKDAVFPQLVEFSAASLGERLYVARYANAFPILAAIRHNMQSTMHHVIECRHANTRALGLRTPTPIQKHAVGAMMSGADVMACAQTGSGKTAAYVLPMVKNMLDRGAPATGAFFGGLMAPAGLVLAPTRELAIQVCAACAGQCDAVRCDAM